MIIDSKETLAKKKYAKRQLGHVLILGLGKTGKAAFRYCYNLLGSRVASLSVAAGDSNQSSQEFIAGFDASRFSASFDTDTFSDIYDVCIVSPGISQCSDFYQNAKQASTELISEVEFAWRESAENSIWIAITGTNGKTTTTELATHLLRKAHKNAAAVGNIGETCLGAVASGKVDIYVAEVSSYQLASTKYFAPQIAAILNITPDHTSWHGSHEKYREAKLSILKNLSDQKNSWAVFDATDNEVRAILKNTITQDGEKRGYNYVPLGAKEGITADMRHVCGSENAAFVSSGRLCVAMQGHEHVLAHIDDLKIRGDHNYANALTASAIACIFEIDDATISAALTSFKPLPHRIEPCGSVLGVACYNDSKATNPDATQKALTAFGNAKPFVLLGGFDKGSDLSTFVEEVEKNACAAVCFGAAGSRFYKAFSHASIPVYQADKLEEALDVALVHAREGDAIVLSPACASFDEFSSYEQRGDVFKRLVKQRSQDRGV